ncbi:xanthine dehydrogenase accessory protein XdhC [Sulfitobacter sp. HNIBRBA3233]|uniref:xanthine dehydrogenase accessory protein XdhC n=1 Tax=Sulfitobacter marinivivus TaxID=3158558 RepID=UPI0032DE5939
MSVIYVEITATRGSAPRDAGTAMAVTANGITGTIGGGALEHRAIATARRMLSEGCDHMAETIPLGPGLGQCCGGAVTLAYGREVRRTDPRGPVTNGFAGCLGPAQSLWVWGAGHVGRAVVATAPSQMFDITWIDSAADRFPAEMPPNVTALPAADMPLLAQRAARQAHHLILTYSHDIDFALCAALLQRGPKSIGLIGSDTKWRRFSRRLADLGHDPARITCPIGDKSLGKAPPQIAEGVIRDLVSDPTMKKFA